METLTFPRLLFAAACLAATSLTALAETRSCLVSFDVGALDVCAGRVSLSNDGLKHLADEQVFAGTGVRIVKFDAPITADQRARLTALGAEILGYVPYYGYKVRMDAGLDRDARAIDGVIWSGPYYPVWKISINLANELADGRILNQAAELDSLWVSLHSGVSRSQARAHLESIPGLEFRFGGDGADHEFMVLRFQRAQLPAVVEQLVMNEDVNAVTFHWPNELKNSQGAWLHQSGENSPNELVPIFDQGIFGCGQVASALDSGLHTSHCSYEDTVFGAPVSTMCGNGAACPPITPDFDHRKVGAHYQWRNNTSAPGDAHGHGTFVSGNMVGNNHADAVDCATFTSPGGITNLDGMAPGAKMIIQEAGPSLDYLNFNGGTLYHAATVAHGNGAYIHNNSWGSSCRNQSNQCISGCQVEYRPHTRGGDMAAWENPELLIVAAAGNSGAGCGPGADVGAPGNAKNVFSIAANNRGASGNNMAGFSSRGPTNDRRTKPDVTAQGAALQSASVSACGTAPNSGTSFSSPTVAGLAALVREYLQRGFYPLGLEEPSNAISNPTAALIKAIMINGSVEIDGTGTSGVFPDVNQGWGRVLLDNSLYFDGDDRRLWLHEETTGLQTGDVDVHQVSADTGEPLTITLVWHDFAAVENANPAIVNMLRLEVEAPGGDVWTQKLSPGGGLADPNPFQGTSLDDYDDRNTVHQIIFDALQVGTYEVRVRAIQVAMGDEQPYALAVTGDLPGGDPRSVGGEVQGLAGEGLVLQVNGGADLEITENGPFTFASPLFEGQSYAVTVAAQPANPDQECEVANGEGTIGELDIDDVLVSCETLPVLTASTPAIDFGELNVGDALSLEFEIENAAPAPARVLELASLEVTDGEPEFALTGGDCDTGTVLEAGEACTVEITFGADAVGEFAGTVTVESLDGQAETIALSGSADQDPAELEVVPGALDFGAVVPGDTGTAVVTVSNAAAEGAADLELTQVEIIAGQDYFSIDAGGSDCGEILAPQQSCAIEIHFTPDAEAAYSGLLRVAAGGETVNVTLSGTGAEPTPNIFEDRFEEL